MPDILSQSEIDELLSALAAGSTEEIKEESKESEGKVSAYDFKTASKFPKEQVRTLNIIHQTYGQLLANQLVALLQTSCEVELVAVEELTFNEFINSLPTPVILAIIDMPPLKGSFIMQVSSEVIYSIITRLFGGTSSKVESGKAFTEIELSVVERILRQTMGLFEEAWKKVIAVDATLSRIETSSQFAQIVGINDPVAIITLSATIGSENGIINICLPRVAIDPVAKQLTTRLWYAGTQINRIVSESESIGKKIVSAKVTLHAVFNDTDAVLQDVLNLQVGDVIRLNQRADEPITVKVQHIPKFRGTIGTKGSQYAIRIVDIIGEESRDE